MEATVIHQLYPSVCISRLTLIMDQTRHPRWVSLRHTGLRNQMLIDASTYVVFILLLRSYMYHYQRCSLLTQRLPHSARSSWPQGDADRKSDVTWVTRGPASCGALSSHSIYLRQETQSRSHARCTTPHPKLGEIPSCSSGARFKFRRKLSKWHCRAAWFWGLGMGAWCFFQDIGWFLIILSSSAQNPTTSNKT